MVLFINEIKHMFNNLNLRILINLYLYKTVSVFM